MSFRLYMTAPRVRVLAWLVVSVVAMSIIAQPADGAEREPGTEVVVRAELIEADPDSFRLIRPVGPDWYLAEQLRTPRLLHTSGSSPADIVPNGFYELAADPLAINQWEHENTGQTGGTVDADVDAAQARSITLGASAQVVAIIDGGIRFDHPDLVGRIWANPGEIPANGLDDDGNGYIDDIHGWDFASGGIGDPDPTDTYGHGTAVSSVVAGAVNGVGMEGIAPGVTVMPLRVCASTSCSLAAVASAIHYAIEAGATVINLSLGRTATTPYTPIEEAIADAGEAGIVVVAAAGNHGADNDDATGYYPASLPLDNVIAVAATDHDDAFATFSVGASNYGATKVDLAAPGKAVTVANLTDWASAEGTSFASPMVAATVALIQTVRASATAPEVKALVLDNVDELPALDGLVLTAGRLNAGRSVFQATAPVAGASAIPQIGTHPTLFTFDASASTDNGTIAEYTWGFPDGTVSHAPIARWAPAMAGTHEVSLTVRDNDGLTNTTWVQVIANAPPIALAEVFPTIGAAPFAVTVDGTASSDPDGDVVSWSWLTPADASNLPATTVVLPEVGVHSIALTVADNRGATAVDEVQVFVGKDFIDTVGSIFREDILWLSANRITVGCNPPHGDRFCPWDTVSRGQVAAFFARMLDLPQPSRDYFSDDDDSVFENDINRLAEAGITYGCGDPGATRYCPERDVDRGQLAAFVARVLELPQASRDYFTDDDDSVFENDINRLAEAGITNGCTSDSYCPDRKAARAHIGAFFRRAFG